MAGGYTGLRECGTNHAVDLWRPGTNKDHSGGGRDRLYSFSFQSLGRLSWGGMRIVWLPLSIYDAWSGCTVWLRARCLHVAYPCPYSMFSVAIARGWWIRRCLRYHKTRLATYPYVLTHANSYASTSTRVRQDPPITRTGGLN